MPYINNEGENKLESFIDDFRNYIFEGMNSSTNKVGVEIELFPFRIEGENKIPLPASLYRKESFNSIYSIIDKHFQKEYGSSYKKRVTDEVRFIIEDLGEISFEPAGQLEISSIPFNTLNGLISNLEGIITTMENILQNYNITLVAYGCNPWYNAAQLGLRNTKERYVIMQDYFNSIGPYGIKMMRQTASVQVNLDLGDESVFAKRWDAINLLSGVFVAIFANSHIIENKIVDYVSMRNHIWQNTDKSRTGFPKYYMDGLCRNQPYTQYIQYAFDARVMFITTQEGIAKVNDNITFREWLRSGIKGIYPSIKDWNMHLSTLFPNVRLRKSFEIRYIDCPLREWIFVPIILITAITYDDDMLEWTIENLGKYRTRLDQMVRTASIYGLADSEIKSISQEVFKKALDAVNNLHERYLNSEHKKLVEDFYKEYTIKGICQADIYQRILDGRI